MAEEFEESEVVFKDTCAEIEGNEEHNYPDLYVSSDEFRRSKPKAKRKKLKRNERNCSSVPMNIPDNVSSWIHCLDSEFFDEEEGDDGEEMVPPHVIIGRRTAGKVMAFSVCTGNGRTLKGRDLSEVRNSILRMTGFLET